MKRILALTLSLLLIVPVFSQEEEPPKSTKKKFNFGIDLFSDIWQDTPENLELKTVNKGASIFGMYNYQFGKSNFSFAFGVGIGSHNLYNNSFVNELNDSTFFTKIPDSIDYKKNKVSLTYLDVPFEFRLKTKGKFRMALGFKAGMLINKHTKYKGDDPMGGSGETILKSTRVKSLESFRYGPTFRIGYKWFNVMAYYQLSNLFKPDKGPEMAPISVGISLMPF